MASELYLMEVGDGRYSILLCDDGSITRMPALTPAETLIAFSELDYADRYSCERLRGLCRGGDFADTGFV